MTTTEKVLYTIKADPHPVLAFSNLIEPRQYKGKGKLGLEAEALEPLICNSELDWVAPEDIGALTSAPILGIRNPAGEVDAAWGFMDYAVRSFVDDLINTGKAIFVS